jgi:uncharacterized membrane protein
MTSQTPLSSRRIPWAVLLPGLAGLIPFWALALSALGSFGLPPVYALFALLTYGAVILSFVGAIWWGMVTTSPDSFNKAPFYLWSVLPALVGWFATLIGPDLGVLLLGLGFLLQWALDAWLAHRGPMALPRWFFPFRTLLTLGVLSALACAWFYLV